MNLTEINIRLTATRLISRNGYASMSLRQLAAEAGINSSTLYIYYKGKSELLLELILQYFQSLSGEWERCRPAGTSAEARLLAFIAVHVRYHLENQDEAKLGNLELRCLEAPELAQVRQARRRYRKHLQDILEQGVRERSFTCRDPKLLARTLFNLLTHACLWYRSGGHLNVEDMIQHYSELVFKMIDPGQPRLLCAIGTGRTPFRATATEVRA